MKSKQLDLTKNKTNKTLPEKPILTSGSIPVQTKTITLKSKRKVKKPINRKKRLTILFITIAILGVLTAAFTYFIFVPAKKVYDSAENIKMHFYQIATDMQNKDISNLEDNLNKVKSEIGNINREIDKFDFLANLEQTRGYYNNFQQAQVILNKSDKLITETLPELKNVLELSGFKVNESPMMQQATSGEPEEEDGAITLILKELPQYLRIYDEIEPKILDIFSEVKKIDPEYVPQIAGFDIRDNLESFNKFADEFPEISEKTVNFVKEVPKLIGSNEETTYLVILQNETEMRSSGGLLTSFGTIKVVNGEIGDDISLTDTWQLQYDMWRIGLAMPRNNIYGQAYLMNANCGATEARVQDVGLYPDLNISMNYFREYYDRVHRYFPEKYPSYDHVLIVNYSFAENLLELVQPLEIEGFGQATAENLYEFIKSETDNPEIFFDEDRKKIIKDLAKAAKTKLLNLGMAEIPKVIDLMLISFESKDVALASGDKTMQAYFDEYGMSGRSEQEFDGDYFQFNEAQNCSLKLNKFIRDTVDLDINIADNGDISNKAKIKWQQTQVYNDSLKDQYSATTQFSYRAWVRLFIPEDSSNIVSDGFRKSGYLYYYPKDYYDEEMNKEVSDNIVQFDHRRFKDSDPIEKQDMNITWDLPESLNYNAVGSYKLLIQKHPGKSWGEKYNININYQGSTTSLDFILDKDKVINFKDGIITLDNYNKKLEWIKELSNQIPWGEISEEETD